MPYGKMNLNVKNNTENETLHPMWITGFVDGEGCFRASILKSEKLRFKAQIQMEFVVVQHVRDIHLLYELQKYFNCGIVDTAKEKNDPLNNIVRFRVRKLADLCDKIIPFFEQHPLITKKKVEFLRFCDLCYLLKQKTPLTEEGFQHCSFLAKTLPYNVNQNEQHKI